MAKSILVTGASGFLASAVVRELLSHNYVVVGTVRSQVKADQIRTHLNVVDERLQFRIVPDMSVAGAFDEAVKGVDGVIHTASPFQVSGITDVEKELLQPAIFGATGILRSIKEHNPSIKRVVLTSSYAAVAGGVRPKHNDTFTEEDWCKMTYDDAKTASPFMAYVASKALAERAAWEFVEEEKPGFTLSTICPPVIYGPIFQPVSQWASLNTSSKDIRVLIDGSSKHVPATSVPFWVDVRDVATAHRLAFEVEAAAGQRYLISAGKKSTEDISDVLRDRFPEFERRIPARQLNQPLEENNIQADSSKAERELGIRFRSFENCIVDSAKSLIELEKNIGN